jgi:hypothetical protein
MQEWRKDGPIGVLIDVINYIKTPQQHNIFNRMQTLAFSELTIEQWRIIEPVKPVVTRWNSYYSCLERATQLQSGINAYASFHIKATADADAYARSRNNKLSAAPSWMRSNGLTSGDWAVITEYMSVLRSLKLATKRLKGRGRSGRFGAIHEIIPVFEYLLNQYETLLKTYESVDYNAHREAPKYHLAINLRAGWAKLNDYYTRLDDSPAYYAETCLHPYSKNCCKLTWADKLEWLTKNNAAFQQLWRQYRPHDIPRARLRRPGNGIDDVIDALLNTEPTTEEEAVDLDEYQRWHRFEPPWSRQQYEADDAITAIQYWLGMKPKYPNLARMAIDVLSIPASSSDCERCFSELGDLLEPRRRKIGPELLAALHCIRS